MDIAVCILHSLATLLSRAITAYLDLIPDSEDGHTYSQPLVPHPKLSGSSGLGRASVFEIVSMAARTIRIIDFMFDSFIQS